MSELIGKKHHVSVLLYHLLCPTKYRKATVTPKVDEKLKQICEEISVGYEIEFLEIGADSDHVHFFVQSVPTYSPTKIVPTIKSITAKEIFRQMPEVKKQLIFFSLSLRPCVNFKYSNRLYKTKKRNPKRLRFELLQSSFRERPETFNAIDI